MNEEHRTDSAQENAPVWEQEAVIEQANAEQKKTGKPELPPRRTGARLPTKEQVTQERDRLYRGVKFRRVLMSTIAILIVVAAAAVLIATLFLPVLQVSGTSMEPTLENGDIILLWKDDDFETGDLVGLRYEGKILLKRVIGGPGDYISIDADGNVYVNGTLLDEPYVTEKSLGECDITFPYQVPDNSWFVLGDHRSVSVDSRNSTIGCIRDEQIIGKVILRIWPLSGLKWIS